ncbi:MBL fold metallo-hydrolase [Bacillus sp. 165]|uniref:MBL fold metallo-hydrolase n=1 Tax=Bacillus sp. 165 TaxID=1529117 RepID=UPI001ADC78E8|nr:MBL fold metallo-hydrolase [Bacillus sp. 165]
MRFENLDSISTKKSVLDFIKWRRARNKKQKDTSFIIEQSPIKQIDYLQGNKSKTTITWIGHSTFLIQSDGLNILTDPVWSNKLKVVSRISNPGLTMEDLPPIHVVLLSHGHYDHLDFTTLRKLHPDVLYLVPAGLQALFKRKGFLNVKEYSWWEAETINEVTFSFVPAQHWTRRTLFDTNRSHWGGWIIEGHEETVYFCGDSGYFRGFKEIGEKYSIDIALMPIGAYEPEWFMKVSHMTPEESIKAYLDLGAHHFIPMHYGAFLLADETPKEALTRLRNEWNRLQLPWEKLHLLFLGQTFTPSVAVNLEEEKELQNMQ